MTIRTASVFEIARLADLQLHDESLFCILIDLHEDKAIIAELNAELDVQTGKPATVIDAEGLSVETLIKRLHSAESSIVVIHGFERWTNEQFTQLDVNRSRLETGRFTVIKASPDNAARLLNCAPNLRSYIGASIFVPVPDLSLMTPEEVNHRLQQLRSHYQMSDEQVIEKATQNKLPLDPRFAEWLVLLDRSELVG